MCTHEGYEVTWVAGHIDILPHFCKEDCDGGLPFEQAMNVIASRLSGYAEGFRTLQSFDEYVRYVDKHSEIINLTERHKPIKEKKND